MKEDTGVSLKDLLGCMKDHILMICAITLVMMTLGGVFAFCVVTPNYQSTSKVIVMVYKADASTVNASNFDITTAQKMVDSVAIYMGNGLVIDKVVEDEAVKAQALEDGIELTESFILSHLSISSSTTNFFVTVRFTSKSPALCKVVVNTVVEKAINIAAEEDISIFKDTLFQMDKADDGVNVSPSKLVYFIVAFFAGIIVSVIIIFLKEMFDNTFHSSSEIEKVTFLQNLGFVTNRISEVDETKRYTLEKNNMYYYEKLVVNLDFANIDSTKKVYQIASSVEKEGKTLTLLYLAWINQQRNKKVIILDLDLRKPRIHKALNMSNEVGITDYISGKISKKELIKKSEYGFDVCVSGSKSPFILDMLGSKKLEQFIDELKEEYDYVLIDTPPVSVAADSICLVKYVDLVVFLVSYKNVRRNVCVSALKELVEAKALIAGTFFTGVDGKKIKDYDNYYYGAEKRIKER